MTNAKNIGGVMIRDERGFYDKRVREIILRFLASCSIDAGDKLASEVAMAGDDADKPFFSGRIKYWRHVQSAAKYFAHLSGRKQSHLDYLSDEMIAAMEKEWNQQTPT